MRSTRYDGLYNVLTRLGDVNRDKSANTTYVPGSTLSTYTIDALYEHEAIAARIIDRPADDLTREGFELEEIEGVDVPRVMSDLECLGRQGDDERPLLACISDLHRWGNKDGGALLCAAVDDGRPPHEPLELSAIRRVAGFFVLERDDVTPVTIGIRPPEAYTINGLVDVPIEERTIHASRCLKFIGPTISQRRQRSMQWWGISKLQRVWDKLRQYLSAMGYGESLLHEMCLDVIQLEGHADMQMQEDGEDLLFRRLLNLKLGQDILHATVLDAKDSYTPVTKSAGSIPELLEHYRSGIVEATDMPRCVLLGETPGGLNSGENAGEIRSYYDSISVEQEQKGTPWLNWCLEIVFASQEGPTSGKVPAEWTAKWRPLWQPTDKERADVREVNARTDAIMVNLGAAAVEEVRKTRIVQGSVGHLEHLEEHDDVTDLPEPGLEDLDAVQGEPPEEPAAEPTVDGGTEDVQREALNGAQISSFLQIVEGVRSGTIPYATARKLIPVAFPGVVPTEQDAEYLIEDVEPASAPAPTPAPSPTVPEEPPADA